MLILFCIIKFTQYIIIYSLSATDNFTIVHLFCKQNGCKNSNSGFYGKFNVKSEIQNAVFALIQCYKTRILIDWFHN